MTDDKKRYVFMPSDYHWYMVPLELKDKFIEASTIADNSERNINVTL